MQPFQCAQTWQAYSYAFGYHCLGIPHPAIREGKAEWYGNYTHTTSSKKKAIMTRDAQSGIYKRAFRAAGYADNGQITHRPRHDGAVTARLQHDLGTDALACMGDWQQKVLQQIYARLPAASDLATFAGFGVRSAYVIVEGLLDPSLMPEYRDMVMAFYADIPEMLESHKQVHMTCMWSQTVSKLSEELSVQCMLVVKPTA